MQELLVALIVLAALAYACLPLCPSGWRQRLALSRARRSAPPYVACGGCPLGQECGKRAARSGGALRRG